MENSASTSPSPEVGRRILLCLDRSPSSEDCVPYAVSLAKTFGSAITIVHVLRPRHDSYGPQTTDALAWEISMQEARSYLDRMEREISALLGKPVTSRLEQGRPAERIVDLSRELSADITVLGSHGDGSDPSRVLGSTTQQVLSLARNSVLIAHSSSNAPAVVTLRRILVPLDGSVRTESVLPMVARMAMAHRAEVLLIHIVQEPLPTALLETAGGLDLAMELADCLESGAHKYLEQLQRHLVREGADVSVLVRRHQNHRQALLEIVRKDHSDLIVLSAHGSTCDAGRAFGSVTAHLLNGSTVPILVLQDLPESDLPPVRPLDTGIAPQMRSSRYDESANA